MHEKTKEFLDAAGGPGKADTLRPEDAAPEIARAARTATRIRSEAARLRGLWIEAELYEDDAAAAGQVAEMDARLGGIERLAADAAEVSRKLVKALRDLEAQNERIREDRGL